MDADGQTVSLQLFIGDHHQIPKKLSLVFDDPQHKKWQIDFLDFLASTLIRVNPMCSNE